MNVALVGHGMTGAWHARALRDTGAVLHTVVGRRPEPTRAFAELHGFRAWSTDVDAVLDDPAVDAVILASPSETHAPLGRRALEAGRHCLVEIPLAMSLADAESLVAAGRRADRRLGVVHPLRVRAELVALRARLQAGEERAHHVGGRFFLHRVENVGASGYRRSWTDNLLWHHLCHLVDAGLWLSDGAVQTRYAAMPAVDPLTGIPMEATVALESATEQSLVFTGSYHGRERIFDLLVVTDRDSYRLDVFAGTLTTGAGTRPILDEEANCALVTRDFVAAVRDGRPPCVDGASVLPALRELQAAQAGWDARHAAGSVPGRPLPMDETRGGVDAHPG